MARKHLNITTATGCSLLLLAGLSTACLDAEGGRDGNVWGGEDELPEPDDELPEPDGLPPTSPIYGGTDVATCGWPTTVSLGGSCSGTLVHERVVVYAAHCGSDYDSVRLGESVYSGNGGRSVPTERCAIYPGGGPGEGDDFAYCVLAEAVDDVPLVPILMGCEVDEYLRAGQEVTVVGFGNADTGPYGVKREVVTQINSITAKGEAHVGGGGKDSCQGDSGGPVFVQTDDGSWRVFGITSYGGACGGGGYYSMMHNGMAWFESQTGYDLTPCHDADGTWNPGPDCSSFPLSPGDGTGTWASGCSGGAATGYGAACGAPYADDGGGDDGGGDGGGGDGGGGDPGVCPGCDRYAGTLSGSGDADYQPDGTYYYAASGEHRGYLSGPAGTDFDLRLWKWNGSGWSTVGSSLSTSSDEEIVVQGSAGYYAWKIESYSGSGQYELQLDLP
ncbi:MAG: trypsin-like serine protease [Myxococcales bacterium]|nr:trypsin-like serine protease [Myxococcales bacterium]